MDRFSHIFAGQGAQFAGMGKRLAEHSPAARRVFEQADALLQTPISRLCFEGSLEELTPCAVCQPAIFVVSMAAHAAHMEAGGAAPVACGGLSLGEFSAACATNIFSLETGLRLVAARGRLMDQCCQSHPGGMAAIIAGKPEEIELVCQECDIDVANYNCPGQIVISGAHDRLEQAIARLAPKCLKAVKLTVAGAYHSRLMQDAAEQFGQLLEQADLHEPTSLFVQNVTGKPAHDIPTIRENLRLQIAHSVRWEDCARTLMDHSDRFLEFGPGAILSGFMKRINHAFPAAPAFPEI